jgi:hypothetical protein
MVLDARIPIGSSNKLPRHRLCVRRRQSAAEYPTLAMAAARPCVPNEQSAAMMPAAAAGGRSDQPTRDDTDLLAALRAGDEASFTLLVERYHTVMVRLHALRGGLQARARSCSLWLHIVRIVLVTFSERHHAYLPTRSQTVRSPAAIHSAGALRSLEPSRRLQLFAALPGVAGGH